MYWEGSVDAEYKYRDIILMMNYGAVPTLLYMIVVGWCGYPIMILKPAVVGPEIAGEQKNWAGIDFVLKAWHHRTIKHDCVIF